MRITEFKVVAFLFFLFFNLWLLAKLKLCIVLQLQELLKDKPVRIKLDSFEPADEPDKTEIFFTVFDASQTKENVPVPVEDLLYYTGSLNATNITVKGGVIYWDGKCW